MHNPPAHHPSRSCIIDGYQAAQAHHNYKQEHQKWIGLRLRIKSMRIDHVGVSAYKDGGKSR